MAVSFGIVEEALQAISWDHEIVPGCMHAMRWREGMVIRIFLNLHLSSPSAAERAHQLRTASSWIHGFQQRFREVQHDGSLADFEGMFGGDRNFADFPEKHFLLGDEGRLAPRGISVASLGYVQVGNGRGTSCGTARVYLETGESATAGIVKTS